jgi:hypothetical protein
MLWNSEECRVFHSRLKIFSGLRGNLQKFSIISAICLASTAVAFHMQLSFDHLPFSASVCLSLFMYACLCAFSLFKNYLFLSVLHGFLLVYICLFLVVSLTVCVYLCLGFFSVPVCISHCLSVYCMSLCHSVCISDWFPFLPGVRFCHCLFVSCLGFVYICLY